MSGSTAPVRSTVVWVPDWSVAAAMVVAGVPVHLPAAVHDSRRVLGCSAPARAQGVRRGMSRRRAQGCCPELVLLPAQAERDVIAFEQVAAAAETVVAGVEVVRPGLLLLPSGGAGRYHRSEEALAAALVEAVAGRAGYECGVGTADGLLAAVLAARTTALVEPGASPAFLASFGIGELSVAVTHDEQAAEVAGLVDLLVRLGVRTLGALAGLPASDVHSRFGRLGVWAHTLALGEDLRPPVRRRPVADLEVAAEPDPPVTRVDQTAFVARGLAEQLHARLVAEGLTCGRLRISARTAAGAELTRVWRSDAGWGGLTSARVTDRVRWQAEGWLTAGLGASGHPNPGDGLVRVVLTALDVTAAGAQQDVLWGAPSGGDIRAHRAMDRVQQLVGGSGVLTAAVQGGRTPREQVHLAVWGRAEPAPRGTDLPWPGRLPDPAPSLLRVDPPVVQLSDEAGRAVLLDDRGRLSGVPCAVGPAGERHPVVGWAGPWPAMSRWWRGEPVGPAGHLQVLLADTRVLLLAAGPDGWTWDGDYD